METKETRKMAKKQAIKLEKQKLKIQLYRAKTKTPVLKTLLYLSILLLFSFLTWFLLQKPVSNEKRIETIEKDFLSYETIIKKNLPTVSTIFLKQETVTTIFDMVKYNQNNSQRFKSLMDQPGTENILIDAQYFFYSIESGMKGSNAGFYIPLRQMRLDPSFDSKNTLHQLGFFAHELIHAMQDVAEIQMKNLTPTGIKVYDDFIHANTSCTTWETAAYVMEIELLNVYLDGKLAEKVRDNTLNVKWLKRNLRCSKKDEETLKDFVSLVSVYYKNFDTFFDHIAKLYQSHGKQVYEWDGKSFVPYHHNGRRYDIF